MMTFGLDSKPMKGTLQVDLLILALSLSLHTGRPTFLGIP